MPAHDVTKHCCRRPGRRLARGMRDDDLDLGTITTLSYSADPVHGTGRPVELTNHTRLPRTTLYGVRNVYHFSNRQDEPHNQHYRIDSGGDTRKYSCQATASFAIVPRMNKIAFTGKPTERVLDVRLVSIKKTAQKIDA
ncbi:hypothetical protein IF1G_01272 [Cordyceps javanica]|uniref:Uncharacterized protein n=1 Tax=Cordyceps javanica TaxID=43265 RepID=A0A545VBE9_9HYPO|nr:hypothetical protein IF1G_01272 [Cordyceps javanica]TQW11265.1 hypothetical protein IF2G_02207 [Cordyceps javanica]